MKTKKTHEFISNHDLREYFMQIYEYFIDRWKARKDAPRSVNLLIMTNHQLNLSNRSIISTLLAPANVHISGLSLSGLPDVNQFLQNSVLNSV